MARPKKRGPGYVARWRDADGNQRSKQGFLTPQERDIFVATMKGTVVSGSYVDPRSGNITFREYAEIWRDDQVHADNTSTRIESTLRIHIYPTFGNRRLASILHSEIQGWVKRHTGAPGSVAADFAWLSTIFAAAVRDRLIPSSPCPRTKLPPIPPNKIVPLEFGQVLDMAAAMPEVYRAFVLFCAGSGLRPAEAKGLTVDRLDFLRREVRVDQQLQGVSGGVPRIGPPLKTKSSYRTVPLPNWVLEAVAAHLARWPAGPYGLVFTNTEGRPIRRNTFDDAWKRAARSAGLPLWATAHDLRHHYASVLIAEGLDVVIVAARLGHKSPLETLKTYAHLFKNSDDRSRAAGDAVFRREMEMRDQHGTLSERGGSAG